MTDQPEPTEQEHERIDELPEHQAMQAAGHEDPELPGDEPSDRPGDES